MLSHGKCIETHCPTCWPDGLTQQYAKEFSEACFNGIVCWEDFKHFNPDPTVQTDAWNMVTDYMLHNMLLKSNEVANFLHPPAPVNVPQDPFSFVSPGKSKKGQIESTFVMLKPDAFDRGLVGEIMSLIDRRDLKLVLAKTLVCTEKQVTQNYQHHVGKDFWPELVDFMTSGLSLALVYKGKRACDAVRQLIGSKHPSESPPGSIRGKYASAFPQNLIHGSDTYLDADREMRIFFTEDEIKRIKEFDVEVDNGI